VDVDVVLLAADVNALRRGIAWGGNTFTVRHGHGQTRAWLERDAGRLAMSMSMKLCDEPESRSATATAPPMETKTFIVWQPLARTPVTACREMIDASRARVSAAHSISSSTSSSSS
jgi:hypothetical protein